MMDKISRSFLKDNPIPKGYALYTDATRIRGLDYRKSDALQFIKGKNQTISSRECGPMESYPGAWGIIGHWSGMVFKKSALLGHVPAEMNAQATQSELKAHIKIRLASIYMVDDDYFGVQFQLVGPRDKLNIFKSFAQECESKNPDVEDEDDLDDDI